LQNLSSVHFLEVSSSVWGNCSLGIKIYRPYTQLHGCQQGVRGSAKRI
jgi:hypothetical protein